MFRAYWLYNLFGLNRSQNQRPRKAPSRQPVSLTLESLEERLTPSGGATTVTQQAGSYGAVQSSPPAAPVNISFSPQSLTVNRGTTSVNVAATVSDALGNPVNGMTTGGTVTFSVLESSNTKVGSSVTVPVSTTGQANTSLSLPPNLAAGNYTVQAVFTSDNGSYAVTTKMETLTAFGATAPSSPTPSPVTLTAGNGTATFSSASQTVSITVGVSSSTAVNVGTVSVMLFNSAGTPVTSNASNVSNGKAIVELTIPAGFPAGTYTLTEVYTDDSQHFAANSTTGTLTINSSSSPSTSPSPSPSPSPSQSLTQSQAYMTIAIDVAALLLQGNSVALTGLWDLSWALLQKPLGPPSDLLAEIFVDMPYAGDQAASAVQLGILFAESSSSEITGSGGAKSFIL